jgi:hypothetical protein
VVGVALLLVPEDLQPLVAMKRLPHEVHANFDRFFEQGITQAFAALQCKLMRVQQGCTAVHNDSTLWIILALMAQQNFSLR